VADFVRVKIEGERPMDYEVSDVKVVTHGVIVPAVEKGSFHLIPWHRIEDLSSANPDVLERLVSVRGYQQ
jgi:hypothetical protein